MLPPMTEREFRHKLLALKGHMALQQADLAILKVIVYLNWPYPRWLRRWSMAHRLHIIREMRRLEAHAAERKGQGSKSANGVPD